MKIEPHYFKDTIVNVYNPDGSLLCEANYNTIMDLRFQIAQNKLEGFTYEWEGKKGTINTRGELSDWFYGMFDLEQDLMARIFRAQRGETTIETEDSVYNKMLIK